MFRAFDKLRIPGFVPVSADINDPNSLLAGYRSRLLRNNPKRDPEYMKMLPGFSRMLVAYLFGGVKARRLPFEEWLESTSYSMARKDQLRKVYYGNHMQLPSMRKCHKVKGFGKTECNASWQKTPRNIMSRVDDVKVIFGPIFKAIELIVYHCKYFVKHLTPEQKMDRVRHMLCGTGFYCFESDYSGWESVFDPEMMEACEMWLYKSMMSPADYHRVHGVLCGWNNIKGRGFSVKCKGKRCSGEMNTSLGNGFSNICLTLFLIWIKLGKPTIDVLLKHYDGIVEGDDQLAVTDVDLNAQDFAKLGISIKMERRPRPCEASFCGMVFTSSGEIVREPIRFMEKFGWTSSFLASDEGMMDSLLRAKALSTLFETPQCPIVAPLAHRALKLTRGVNPRFICDGFHEKMPDEWQVPDYHPTDEVRVMFSSLYGISVASQYEAERAIAKGDMQRLSEIVTAPRSYLLYEARYVLKL